MKINIGIVDDKAINRQSAKEKLVDYKEVEIVLEAVNGLDFMEQLKASKLLPNVVLMDLEMPELDGIQTISMATAAYPSVKFIVLTVFQDNQRIFEAIKAGASGYLLKEDNATKLIDAITNVHEFNGIPMSPVIARKAMDLLIQYPVVEDTLIAEEDGAMELKNLKESVGLSKREMEILKELVSGKSYKAIGEKLFISAMTVRKHVSHIYLKLHVNSRAQIINIAHKHNWL